MFEATLQPLWSERDMRQRKRLPFVRPLLCPTSFDL